MRNVTPKSGRTRVYEVMMGLLSILFYLSALIMLALGGVILFGGTAMLAFARRFGQEDQS